MIEENIGQAVENAMATAAETVTAEEIEGLKAELRGAVSNGSVHKKRPCWAKAKIDSALNELLADGFLERIGRLGNRYMVSEKHVQPVQTVQQVQPVQPVQQRTKLSAPLSGIKSKRQESAESHETKFHQRFNQLLAMAEKMPVRNDIISRTMSTIVDRVNMLNEAIHGFESRLGINLGDMIVIVENTKHGDTDGVTISSNGSILFRFPWRWNIDQRWADNIVCRVEKGVNSRLEEVVQKISAVALRNEYAAEQLSEL